LEYFARLATSNSQIFRFPPFTLSARRDDQEVIAC
jgi:hypothetical protein